MRKFWTKIILPVKRRITIDPVWQSIIDVPALCASLEAYLVTGNVETFKDDPAAKVVAIDFCGKKVILKHYKAKNPIKFLSRSLRSSKAKRTWDNANYLHDKNIETLKPIALIEDRFLFFRFKSFFIGTFIPGQDARSFFNDRSNSLSMRIAVAEKIVDSLIELHSKNIFIGDTKDTNIIVGKDKVFWVDLEELSRPKWNWMKSRKMIRDWQVLIYNWRNNSNARKLFYDAVKKRFGRQCYWSIARQAAIYSKKKFKIDEINSRFQWRDEDANKLLSQVRQITRGMIPSDWRKVDSSGSAIVVLRERNGKIFYCKVFLPRNRKEGLKRLFRPGRGERAVRNEQMMAAAGFSVPETLLWERSKGREYVVSIGVTGESILSWLNHHRHEPKLIRAVSQRLGEQVAELHMAGFAHGDLRLGNILLKGTAEDPEFVFIDNERTTLYKNIPTKMIIQNLRQINTDAVFGLSRSNRLRIFKAYQNTCSAFKKEDEKNVINKIEWLTSKRLAASSK